MRRFEGHDELATKGGVPLVGRRPSLELAKQPHAKWRMDTRQSCMRKPLRQLHASFDHACCAVALTAPHRCACGLLPRPGSKVVMVGLTQAALASGGFRSLLRRLRTLDPCSTPAPFMTILTRTSVRCPAGRSRQDSSWDSHTVLLPGHPWCKA